MSNRTLSIAVAVLLVLGVLLSAVVMMQNQQLLILADSVQRLSDQAERTFGIVQKRAMEGKEATSPDTSERVMEPVAQDLIATDVDQVFLVKRTYPHAIETSTTCTDYKIVATAGGPSQDVLLASFVAALGSEVIGEGGGCIDYTLRLGDAQDVLWIQVVWEDANAISSPALMIKPTSIVSRYQNKVHGGTPFRDGRYWVGAFDTNTLAVIDLRDDRIVATYDITPGRTLVQEADLISSYGDVEVMGNRSVRFDTFLPCTDPACTVSTDRRVDTWTLPSLP